MKLLSAVVVAFSLAAVGVASADAPAPMAKKPMMHKPMASHTMMHKPMASHMMMHHSMMHMHWAKCGEGMVKAACVCKGETAHAMCKGGQWCHSWAGVCTM
jgi:hypothetical protein